MGIALPAAGLDDRNVEKGVPVDKRGLMVAGVIFALERLIQASWRRCIASPYKNVLSSAMRLALKPVSSALGEFGRNQFGAVSFV
jgi:hypothetical protein